jgi:hypothetical protein
MRERREPRAPSLRVVVEVDMVAPRVEMVMIASGTGRVNRVN